MKRLLVTTLVGITLLSEVTSTLGDIIYANDDVFVETSSDGLTTTTYDGYTSGQIAFGLAAANGIATGRRRSFIEFTIGSTPVASATFMIYNYWGAAMGGGANTAGNGQIRVRATPIGTPVTITEPTLNLDTTWVPPTDAQFTSSLVANQSVTTLGWQSVDVTAWYNARLGQTTTLQIHGIQTAGFDFPIFEDRENTAFLNGSDNTITDAGPRLVTLVPEPSSIALLMVGAALVIRRRR